jgi:hypothetical protein
MKILQVAAELLHEDSHDEENNHFSQYCEQAYNCTFCPHGVFLCSVLRTSEQTAIFARTPSIYLFLQQR